MLRKFTSIAHSAEYGYSFDTEAWTQSASIESSFRMFQTYGDGLIQHSNDYPITPDFFSDYLISLTAVMLTDEELVQRMDFTLHREPNIGSIEFAASIEFKPVEGSSYEKKTRYFSLSERKITSDPKKEYDKRYERILSSHTGQPLSIYNMLLPEYASGLQKYLYAHAIHSWAMSAEGQWMDLPGVFLDWTKDRDEARSMQHALEAAQNACRAYQLRCAAQGEVDNFKRYAERAAAKKAEQATTEEVA